MFSIPYKDGLAQVSQDPNGRNQLHLNDGSATEGITPEGLYKLLAARTLPVLPNGLSSQSFVSQRAELDPRYAQLPEATQAIINYCETHQLPVCIGPNTQETLAGCDDASLVRDRIIAAQEAVPVYDEMQSLLLKVKTAGTPETKPQRDQDKKIIVPGQMAIPGETIFVVVHTRGNRLLDFDKVKQTLSDLVGANLELEFSAQGLKGLRQVEEKDLEAFFGLSHGTVTPFIEAKRDHFSAETQGAQIVQVFDTDCLKSFGMGMTTNAHDAGWATEFKPWEVIPKLEKAHPKHIFTADIVRDGPSETLAQVNSVQQKVIGLIEYGFSATQLFRERLEFYRKQKLQSLTEPRYSVVKDPNSNTRLVTHTPQALEMAGTFSELQIRLASDPSLEAVMAPDAYQEEVANRLDELIAGFVTQRVNLVMLPCNILPFYVTDYFGDKVPFLDIRIAVESALDEMQNYALLGGQSVNSPQLTVYPEAQKNSLELSSDEQKQIERAMMAINNDHFKEADQILFSVLKDKDLPAIVIAATSLSVAYYHRGCQLLDPQNFEPAEQPEVERINNIKVIDTLDVYSQYCARALFSPKSNH